MTVNSDDLMRVKQKISGGIPRHAIEINARSGRLNNQSLDVEKIATSDDLINILEDNYRNDSSYTKKERENEQYIEEAFTDGQHIDLTDYLKSIATITYEELYENYINCMVSERKKKLKLNNSYNLNTK